MLMDKRILITGGGGFIGTALASRLAPNNSITLLDVAFDQNCYAFSGLCNNPNVKTIVSDICKEEQIEDIVHNAQIIIHCAAVLGVQRVIENSIRTIEVNYSGTANLLRILSRNNTCECFLLFSTSEIHGANAFRVVEEGDAVFYSIQNPRWCYAISKLASEQLCLGYYREKGLPAVIVRPFNVYGPGRASSYAILQFILSALNNEDLIVHGDGSQIRAWCYIDDFLDGILPALERKEAIGHVFNIGNPRNTLTIYELARAIIRLSGSRSKISCKILDYKDIDIRVPDITYARKVLDFRPKFDIDDGLSLTIEWAKNNYERLISSKVKGWE